MDEKRVKIKYRPREQFRSFHDRKQRWSVLVCHRRAVLLRSLGPRSIAPVHACVGSMSAAIPTHGSPYWDGYGWVYPRVRVCE